MTELPIDPFEPPTAPLLHDSEVRGGRPSATVVGDNSKRRIFAFTLDNLFSIVAFVLPAKFLWDRSHAMAISLSLASYFLYFAVCEWQFRATPGKALFQLHVVSADGSRLSLNQAVLRTVFRIVEANPAFLGGMVAGISIAITKRHQRLGDIVAGTFVCRRPTGNAA